MKAKKSHGGYREGAGSKPIHTDPSIKVRTKKLRATDAEWERFLQLIPTNSRDAFLELLELLDQ